MVLLLPGLGLVLQLLQLPQLPQLPEAVLQLLPPAELWLLLLWPRQRWRMRWSTCERVRVHGWGLLASLILLPMP